MNDILSSIVEFFKNLPLFYKQLFFIPLCVSMLCFCVHFISNAFCVSPNISSNEIQSDFEFEQCEKSSVDDVIFIDSSVIPTNCINCGAPLNGNSKCEYCGTVY